MFLKRLRFCQFVSKVFHLEFFSLDKLLSSYNGWSKITGLYNQI